MYKVGQKVRIVSEKRGYHWNDEGKMDKWLGKVMTINEVHEGVFENVYYMKEDAGEFHHGALNGWSWHPHMIEGLAEFTKDDIVAGMLVELRSGSERLVIPTTNNGVVLKEYDEDDYARCCTLDNYDAELKNTSLGSNYDIMKVYGFAENVGDRVSLFDTDYRELLFEREEVAPVEEMTLEEVCQALGKTIKIVKE